MNKRKALLAGSALLLVALVFVVARTYWAPAIEGWVVDAETGAPLDGVYVLSHWALQSGLEGSRSSDLVLMEAVTDKDGRFYFPGWGPIVVPLRLWDARLKIGTPEIVVFKPGYKWLALSNQNYAGTIVQSEWHGKRIPLEKFDGTTAAYALSVSGIMTGVSYGGCGWTRIPRMMLALDAQASTFASSGVFHNVPTIHELEITSRGRECANVRDILNRSIK